MRAILACLSLLLTNVRFANAQPQPFSCDENTLCLYHFDEPSGSIVYDECNLSNMGVARGTDIIPGVFGNARRFDGIDDYIPITDLSSSPNNQMTIEAWIYVRNYPVCSDWKYVYKRRGDTADHSLGIDCFRRLEFTLCDGDRCYSLTSSIAVPRRQWVHVAGTYDGTTMRVYIDGIETGAIDQSIIIAWDPLLATSIGRDPDGQSGRYFDGYVDELRVSDIARPVTNPPSLSNLQWVDVNGSELTMIHDGATVYAKLITSGYPGGTQFTAEVYEQDEVVNDFKGSILITVDENGIGQGEWIVLWENDFLDGDPEFFFEINGQESPLLKVTKAADIFVPFTSFTVNQSGFPSTEMPYTNDELSLLPGSISLFEGMSDDEILQFPLQASRIQALLSKNVAVRIRPVRVRAGLLQDSETILLNLLEDLEVEAKRKTIKRHDNITWTWFGGVESNALKTLMLTSRRGQLEGSLNFGGRSFMVVPLGGEIHAIVELGPEHVDIPECGTIAREETFDLSETKRRVAVDDGTVIRVLVAYTAAARQWAEVWAGDINSIIIDAIQAANVSNVNSGALLNIELAYTFEVDYVESGTHERDLDSLTSTNDGVMDEVHAFRDLYSADACILLSHGNTDASGLAWLTVGDTFIESHAFGTVEVRMASRDSWWTLTHELGHIQGGAHNGEFQLPSYAHGYKKEDLSWWTIMAINDPLPSNRIQFWSDPDGLYNGEPRGDSESDNTQRLSETAIPISNYRVGDVGTAVKNVGSRLLRVTSIASNVSWLTTLDQIFPLRIAAGDSLIVPLDIDWLSITGQVQAQLTIRTNDPDESRLIVSVTAIPAMGGESTLTQEVQFENIYASENGLPFKFSLLQNYPNPFNPSTSIQYEIASRSFVSLGICNLLGQQVKDLIEVELEAGFHSVEVRTDGLSSGTYFYKLLAVPIDGSEPFAQTRKMLLIR